MTNDFYISAVTKAQNQYIFSCADFFFGFLHIFAHKLNPLFWHLRAAAGKYAKPDVFSIAAAYPGHRAKQTGLPQSWIFPFRFQWTNLSFLKRVCFFAASFWTFRPKDRFVLKRFSRQIHHSLPAKKPLCRNGKAFLRVLKWFDIICRRCRWP